MISPIFVWTLIFILLLSGCALTAHGLQPATGAPGIMPGLDPSPTPSNSNLPLTCQVTDLNVYISEADGYCFAYPTRFTLGDQPGDKFVLDVSTHECRKKHCNKNNWYAAKSGFWKPGPHLVLEEGFDYLEQSIWLDQYTVIVSDKKWLCTETGFRITLLKPSRPS